MPRCGCANDQCSCRIVAGDGITVDGTGSQQNPVVISATGVEGGGGGGPSFLPGMMMAWGGAIAPAGWLTCDGSERSRTVYAALFAEIGVANGAGDGVNTFNLPPASGRTLIGLDGSHPRGSVGGETTHLLTAAELPSHAHTMTHDHPSTNTSSSGVHDHELGRSPDVGGSPTTVREGAGTSKTLDRQMVESDGAHTHALDVPNFTGNTGSVGAGEPIDMLGPYLAVHWIIKT